MSEPRRRSICLTAVLFFGAVAAAQTPDQLIQAGHWKRAYAALQPALAANPSNATLLCQMAQVKRAYGDLDEARRLAEKAVSLAPTAENHIQLAQVYGDLAQKASVFRQNANTSG